MVFGLTHWEFSFALHTCNLGGVSRVGTNPFTGETVEFHVDNGLTDDEIGRVQSTFDRNGLIGPVESEGYVLHGPGGDTLRFRCDLETSFPVNDIGVEIVVTELLDEHLDLVLDITRAGNLALTSSSGDCVRLVNSAPNAKVLARWPEAQTLSSIAELRLWIEGTIGGRRVGRIPQ